MCDLAIKSKSLKKPRSNASCKRVPMAIESGRPDRISSLVKRELAILISREMQDPRAQMVSVTAVGLSRDKSTAQVFVISSHPEPDEKDKVIQVLTKASGFLRKKLADRVYLKRIPKLIFTYDDSIEHGSRLSALIDDLSRHSDSDPDED